MTPHELAETSVKLLRSVLEEGDSVIPAKNIRARYIYHQALNIYELSKDVLFLDKANRTRASRLLVRPMFESLFCMKAAMDMKTFVEWKAIAEMNHIIDKIDKWVLTADLAKHHQDLKSIGSDLRNSQNSFKKQFPAPSDKRKWNVFEVAAAGDMNDLYITDYFHFSLHTHSNITGLMSASENAINGEILRCSTSTSAQAASFWAMFIKGKKTLLYLTAAEKIAGMILVLQDNGEYEKLNSQGAAKV